MAKKTKKSKADKPDATSEALAAAQWPVSVIADDWSEFKKKYAELKTLTDDADTAWVLLRLWYHE